MNAVRFYLRIYNFWQGFMRWEELLTCCFYIYIYIYVILVLPVETYFNYILYHYCPSLQWREEKFQDQGEFINIVCFLILSLDLGGIFDRHKGETLKDMYFTYFIICFQKSIHLGNLGLWEFRKRVLNLVNLKQLLLMVP